MIKTDEEKETTDRHAHTHTERERDRETHTSLWSCKLTHTPKSIWRGSASSRPFGGEVLISLFFIIL